MSTIFNVSDNLFCELNLTQYIFKIKNLSDLNCLVRVCIASGWTDNLEPKGNHQLFRANSSLSRHQGAHTVSQLKN